MKSRFTMFVIILGLCALCLGGCAVGQTSSHIPVAEDLTVDYLLGDFAVDVNNPYELVGFADYYFIATVNEVVGTSYRHVVVVETEDGGEETLSTPYTEYSIDVLRNIKGTLPVNESILLIKAGGVSQDGKSVVLYEDDMMLEPGKTYAITASAQKDGTLLASGPNSCEVVEDNVNAIAIDSESDVYGSYYINEVKYDRERYECIYGK